MTDAQTVLIILLLVVLVAAGPIVALWAVNTLFGTAIPYTLLNWAAAALLLFLVQARA